MDDRIAGEAAKLATQAQAVFFAVADLLNLEVDRRTHQDSRRQCALI